MPEIGKHSVVWWDPSTLQLGVRGEFGTNHEHLKNDEGGLAAYRAWTENRAHVLEQASRPKNEVFIASRAEEKPPQEIAPEYHFTEATREIRPSGRRFGTRPRGMRDVAYEADDAAIATFVEYTGAFLGGSEEECAGRSVCREVACRIHYWRAHEPPRDAIANILSCYRSKAANFLKASWIWRSPKTGSGLSWTLKPTLT